MALIKHYLKRGEAFAWLDKAKELLYLQQQINQVMTNISPQVRIPVIVMYYENGEISLGVPHQAWLVRVKNLTPKIIEGLEGSGYKVSRIKCKMQIGTSLTVVSVPNRELSEVARQLLQDLMERSDERHSSAASALDVQNATEGVMESTMESTMNQANKPSSLQAALARLLERS